MASTHRIVLLWSDGPATQFKNQYALNCASTLATRFHVDVQWNFFAASHGKGAVDGVGAVAKRCVSKAIMTGTATVDSAHKFCEAMKTVSSMGCHHVDPFFASARAIEFTEAVISSSRQVHSQIIVNNIY